MHVNKEYIKISYPKLFKLGLHQLFLKVYKNNLLCLIFCLTLFTPKKVSKNL